MGQEPSKEAPEPHAFTSLERIERDRYEIWISGLPRSAISNAVTAALTMVLLRKHPGDITAYGWFFSVIILNILRLALTPKMRGWLQSGKMEKTKRVFSLSLWSSGAIWSLPAIALFPNNNLALQSILAVSLLSVSAGAVLSYVVSPRMALVVPALVLVPFTIRCVFEPTYLSVVLALLCILFLTIIYFLEKDWGNYIEQNLQLSLHNEMLSQIMLKQNPATTSLAKCTCRYTRLIAIIAANKMQSTDNSHFQNFERSVFQII